MHFKKKKDNMLMLGMFSLLIAFILGRFDSQYPLIDFFEGVFTGISVVMNFSLLFMFGKEKRMNDNNYIKNERELL